VAEIESTEEPVFDETPESVLLARARDEEVEAALASLPARFRTIVLLADVEDIPLREIASELGCPVGTVASRLARGRNLLRRRLGHLQDSREVGR
jgi:RNA polymerase sigma-70 factor (ECF subfamily)